MLSQESDAAALTSATTSLAAAFVSCAACWTVSVLGQLDSRIAAGLRADMRRNKWVIFKIISSGEEGAKAAVSDCAPWNRGSFRRIAAKNVQDGGDNEQDQEHKEKGPGDVGGGAGDAGEAEDGGDNRHDKKCEGPA